MEINKKCTNSKDTSSHCDPASSHSSSKLSSCTQFISSQNRTKDEPPRCSQKDLGCERKFVASLKASRDTAEFKITITITTIILVDSLCPKPPLHSRANGFVSLTSPTDFKLNEPKPESQNLSGFLRYSLGVRFFPTRLSLRIIKLTSQMRR